jgi:hypothetical protein
VRIPKFALSKMEFQAQRLMNCISDSKKKPDIRRRKRRKDTSFQGTSEQTARSRTRGMEKTKKQIGGFYVWTPAHILLQNSSIF